MPPEWSAHRATWLAWPHNGETWPVNLEQAQSEWVGLCNAISEDEKVFVAIRAEHHQELKNKIGNRSEVELVDIQTNDAWIRDHGPTFVFQTDDKTPIALSWNYNCWGEKYPPFDADQKVAEKIANHTHTPIIRAPIVAEGGAIEVNGAGLMLTTRSCLMNSNRNPGLSMEQLESHLEYLCGVHTVWWYEGPEVEGDDTDGHIDQQARFANESTVLVNSPKINDTAPGHRFTNSKQTDSPRFDIVELARPEPRTMYDREIPSSYLNFYITSRSVIVPQFDDPVDEMAARIIEEHFPSRTVVQLPSINLSTGLGSFHCLTQQQI